MEGTSSRHYTLPDFDHEQFLHTFCSPAIDPVLFEEVFLFPLRLAIQNIHLVKSLGGTLCDLSMGPNVWHLLPFCDYFSDIIVLEMNENCVKEMERWLKKEENALDCAPAARFLPDLGLSSLNLLGKEDILRKKVKRVIVYDPRKEDPAKTSLPQKVDCLINVHALDHVSVDQESYRRYLKALTSNVKIGGVLLASGTFNSQCFGVGDQKFSTFAYDESFLRKVLEEAGFTIKLLEKMKSKLRSEVTKYDEVWIVAATKVREL